MKFSVSPNLNEIDFLTQKINQETEQFGQATPFSIIERNTQQEVIAGANGFVIYGSIYTDQLWVAKEYRRKGLATEIMQQVHAYGHEQRCTMATVQTMSFQNAVSFYEKLGYEQDFLRAGYVEGSQCIFMVKLLTK